MADASPQDRAGARRRPLLQREHRPPDFGIKAQEIAADFHDRAYYGKQRQDEARWVRARAKDGTTRFFRIATAYVIDKGGRLTLALHFVMPEESTVEVRKALLERISPMGLEIGCLLLDKGFPGITVLEYLTREKLPAIIACLVRGKEEPTHPSGEQQQFCLLRTGYLLPLPPVDGLRADHAPARCPITREGTEKQLFVLFIVSSR